jgi:hypothetical protein
MAWSGLQLWTCAAIAALPASLTAQDVDPGGTRLTFGINQSLGITRNPDFDPGNTTVTPQARTSLSLGYLTETRTESLAIDLTSDLLIDDTGTRADSPALSFDYGRTATDADLSVDGSIRRRQADSLQTLADVTAPDGTVVLPTDTGTVNLDGTLTRAQVGGTLSWGKTAPVGYNLGASVVAQRYDGAAATVRDDSVTTSLNGGMRLDITPVLQTTVALRYTYYELEDGSASSGRFGGAIGVAFDRPTGAISASLDVQGTAGGLRLGLQTARTFTLPDTSLTVELGASRAPGGGTQATGRLAYNHTLPRGQINLSASRGFVSTSDGTERQLTTASASYAMPLTPLSSLQIGFDLAQTKDDAGDTALTAALQAAQSFQLTPDWAVSVGARRELRQETGIEDARQESLFVSLGRNFVWRP